MKTLLSFAASLFLVLTACAQNDIPSREAQIKSAVLAAPSEKRAGAMVYGYDQQGEFVVLREGNNEMICLADDPENDGFSAACYHESLEPFMKRGRELRREGKSRGEVVATRKKEVENGELSMPENPATLYVYSADQTDYNPQTGEVKSGHLRYVIHIPYATAESTGLPLSKEAPGRPWLMDPGTHRAHIMITPPRE